MPQSPLNFIAINPARQLAPLHTDVTGRLLINGGNSVNNAVVATAGNQSGAKQLTASINVVTSVPAVNDGVKLPQALAAAVGNSVTIIVADTTNLLLIWPYAGDYMNGALNGALDAEISANKAVIVTCTCVSVGHWWASAAVQAPLD